MCNMKQEAMDRAGETGECFASRSHLATVKCQQTIIATLRGELAAKEAECAEMAQQLADATEACDHMREAAARVKAAAPVAPVAGSAGDDMEFVMALNAYRYADIKGIVGRPHPLDVAFDNLVAYLDSRSVSAPSVDRNAEALADALNTVLWLERRLPQGYGSVPHVTRTIASLRKALAAPAAQPLAPIGAAPVSVAAELIADMKTISRMADTVGRSRAPNNYAMNSGAVEKLVDLETAFEKKVTSAAAQPLAASVVPEGFLLVPIEPTEEMVRATASCLNDEQCDCGWQVYNEDGSVKCQTCADSAAEQYRIAVRAAPSQQPAASEVTK